MAFSPLHFSSRMLFMFSAAVSLALVACGGGGGAGGEPEASSHAAEAGSESSAFGTSQHYLPGKLFMPQGYSQAELFIENHAVCLQLTCKSASSAAACASGELASAQSRVQMKNSSSSLADGELVELGGIWYQETENGANHVGRVTIEAFGCNLAAIPVHLYQLEIDILSREGEESSASGTSSASPLILHGRVTSGSLVIDGEAQPALSGASVRLTYTR